MDGKTRFTHISLRSVSAKRRRIEIVLSFPGETFGIFPNDRAGGVLSFPGETFGIFPNDLGPYDRHARYGTAIKLFDYKFIGDRSNILRGRSLLSRLDLLLPEIALPVRFYEYRHDRRGACLEVGSRRTTMSGLLRRIRKNSANVEKGFPISAPIQPEGEKMIAHIFAFVPEGTSRHGDDNGEGYQGRRLGGVRGYRKREGVLFVRNGQTQGAFPKDFFRREAVMMKPLADDLLVFVECDTLSDPVREDLFMPSRDRLAENDFRQALVDTLEKTIRECEELRELRNRRQQERLSARIEDEKPLADVLQSLIKNSPNLTTLLQLGQRISAPFKTQETKWENNAEFKGEVYPSYFKTKGVQYGTQAKIARPINHRIRLTFETDARNDYFTRPAERGSFDLTWLDPKSSEKKIGVTGPNLRDGIATVTLDLPVKAKVGDQITFISRVSDAQGAFENQVVITVQPSSKHKKGRPSRRRPPGDEKGNQRERPMEVAPPKIRRIYREHWEEVGFDENTAMVVSPLGYTEDESGELHELR